MTAKLDKDLKKLKKVLEEKTKEFNKIKDSNDTKILIDYWITEFGKNPLDLVVDFIKEKGLKLYGGKALHEHLVKFNRGFYAPSDFPDYDVFSPNAWEHARELARRLHNAGFPFVEAKGSILNDHIHQTYKVGVGMTYVLDLTQMGCKSNAILNSKCDECEKSRAGKCVDVFNSVPANDLMDYNPQKEKPKEYRKTHDFKTDSSLYPQCMFVCSPEYLKISMSRELSEPLSQPDRLPKVGTRNYLFNHFFKFDPSVCKVDTHTKPEVLAKSWNKVLKTIEEWIKKNKLLHFGTTAYNFYIKGMPKLPFKKVPVTDFEIYSPDIAVSSTELYDLLNAKYPTYTFTINSKYYSWKEVDHYSIEILGSLKEEPDKKVLLLEMTDHDKCMPYVQYNGVRYCTLERMLYQYRRAYVMRPVLEETNLNIKNYECMLASLLELDKRLGVVNTKSKYRKIIAQCSGEEVSKIQENLRIKSIQKKQMTKKTKYILDDPKPGYITKISPKPLKAVELPYYPELEPLKKYYKRVSKKKNRTGKGKSKKKPSIVSIKYKNTLEMK